MTTKKRKEREIPYEAGTFLLSHYHTRSWALGQVIEAESSGKKRVELRYPGDLLQALERIQREAYSLTVARDEEIPIALADMDLDKASEWAETLKRMIQVSQVATVATLSDALACAIVDKLDPDRILAECREGTDISGLVAMLCDRIVTIMDHSDLSIDLERAQALRTQAREHVEQLWRENRKVTLTMGSGSTRSAARYGSLDKEGESYTFTSGDGKLEITFPADTIIYAHGSNVIIP